MPKVLIPLAQGCEEIEAVSVINILRRAGIEATSAGLDAQPVKGSRGVVLIPDTTLDEALKQEFDMVVLPGGQPGTNNLKADPRIFALLQDMARRGKYTCAICAAPSVLAFAGLLAGKVATSFPGCLDDTSGANLQNEAVVQDGKVVTSRGPGTAMDFALDLVEILAGRPKREEVETSLQRP